MQKLKESWLFTNCLALPHYKGINPLFSPAVSFTTNSVFYVFDEPLNGFYELTAEYKVSELALTPSDIQALTRLRSLGIASIGGLQDISISFDKYLKSIETHNADAYSPFRERVSTPYATLLNTTIEDTSSMDLPTNSYRVVETTWEPQHTYYPVTWVIDEGLLKLQLIDASNKHQLIGFIKQPTNNVAALYDKSLYFDTPLVNDDYFLDMTAVNYISTVSNGDGLSTVVRVGYPKDSNNLGLKVEVLIYGNN